MAYESFVVLAFFLAFLVFVYFLYKLSQMARSKTAGDEEIDILEMVQTRDSGRSTPPDRIIQYNNSAVMAGPLHTPHIIPLPNTAEYFPFSSNLIVNTPGSITASVLGQIDPVPPYRTPGTPGTPASPAVAHLRNTLTPQHLSPSPSYYEPVSSRVAEVDASDGQEGGDHVILDVIGEGRQDIPNQDTQSSTVVGYI